MKLTLQHKVCNFSIDYGEQVVLKKWTGTEWHTCEVGEVVDLNKQQYKISSISSEEMVLIEVENKV